MRGVVLCVVAAIGINAIATAEPAGASMAPAAQSYRPTGAAYQPYQPVIASVLPKRGDIVGVAHPVVVTFSAPVLDRPAAERALDVTSTPAMTGKYEWLENNVV